LESLLTLRWPTDRYLSRRATEYRPVGAGVVGDLRSDRSPGLDFSDLPLDRAAPCPKRAPPWIPPRSDLFGPLQLKVRRQPWSAGHFRSCSANASRSTTCQWPRILPSFTS
jgi:hypothetical protein